MTKTTQRVTVGLTALLFVLTFTFMSVAPARAAVQPGDFHAFAPGVIKVYAPGVNAEGWRATKAIRVWRAALPEGYTIMGVSAPCVGCVVVSLVDEADPALYPGVAGTAGWYPAPEWTGEGAIPWWYCRISLNRSNTAYAPAYKRFVMAHELGHCLGLDHRTFAEGSIMAGDNTPAGVYGPTQQDTTDLRWIYANLPVVNFGGSPA